MGVSLIDRYNGDWEKICVHVYNQIVRRDPIDKNDFIKWMMLQKDYSPSNYKKGLFGDVGLYHHTYKIYKKFRLGENQHHMTLVAGKIGKGKSLLGLQLASLADPTLELERVCYIPPHLFKRLSECKAKQADIIDEGGNFFKGKNAMTRIGRAIGSAFQKVRDLEQFVIVCYDEPEKIDKDILDKFDSIFVKVYDQNEQGDRKYRDYYGFGVTAVQKIIPLLKKKIPISDPQILKYATWKGHNTGEVPLINNLNEDMYRSEKRKFLRDDMKNLYHAWKKVFEAQDQPEQQEDNKGFNDSLISITRTAKLLGIHPDTIRRRFESGDWQPVLIGKRRMLKRSFVQNIIENPQKQPNTEQ